MLTSLRSRLGRCVATALFVAASVVGPSLVAADGMPNEPTPKPLSYSDLSAPAEVVMGVVAASWYVLDAITF